MRESQVFDKEDNDFLDIAEPRYVLTESGEKLTDANVNELMKRVQVDCDLSSLPIRRCQSLVMKLCATGLAMDV